MSKVGNVLKNYESENGHSPVASVLDTITFAKYVPMYMMISIGISLFCFIGINLISWIYLDSVLLCILFTIGSVFGSGYIAMTGFFYFFMVNFIKNIEGVVLGTLGPIEKVYNKWSDKTTMNKRDFILAVLKEEIFPSLVNNAILKKFNVKIAGFFDGVSKEIENQTDENDDANSIYDKMADFFEKQKVAVTKSYFISLKIYGAFSLLIVLLILI